MNVSVIIPVYNSEEFLKELFFCLELCDFENGDEILLLDNGSTDMSTEMCKTKAVQMPSLYKYYRYTDKADSYATRNYGVKNATNEVFIFTDSDCKPQKNWLKAIKDNVKSGSVIAGKIHLEITENTVWEHFDSITHLKSEETEKNHSIATANMAVCRDDFLKIGYFTERFSGGDHEWSQRAAKSGLTISYIPEALVHHPSRKIFEEILKKERRIAYGSGKATAICGGKYSLLILKYILRIFKIDTNIRYSKELYKRGMTFRQIVKFNMDFFKIRGTQIKFAAKGYKGENTRYLMLK